MEPIALHDGRIMQVHDEDACALAHCVIHNPSHHALYTAPLNWRDDRRLFERICIHGIGHPDPDAVAADIELFDADPIERFTHGCDWCCT